MTKGKGKDPLEGLGGPMTRTSARKAKEALQQVLSILSEYRPKFQGEKSKLLVVSWLKWRRTKWHRFVSILECLFCINNGPILVKLADQKYVLG